MDDIKLEKGKRSNYKFIFTSFIAFFLILGLNLSSNLMGKSKINKFQLNLVFCSTV